jgi:hypothetical protein
VYHKHNVAQALLDLFPDIGLEKTKLENECMFFYIPFAFIFIYLFIGDLKVRSRKERIEFFEYYAKVHGFDPNVPDNWYAQNRRNFSLLKVLSPLSFSPFSSPLSPLLTFL